LLLNKNLDDEQNENSEKPVWRPEDGIKHAVKVLLQRINDIPKLESKPESAEKSKEITKVSNAKKSEHAEKRMLAGGSEQANSQSEQVTVSQSQLEDLLKEELAKRLQQNKL